MGPNLRKFVLTAHVACSVGWLGSVAAFLVLAVSGLNGSDDRTIRSAYVSMELIGWFMIVPLSFASLATGLVQALGTTWGLFRHYWVIAKLLINVLSTSLLLLHMQPVTHMAQVARSASGSLSDHRGTSVQLVFDAGAALAALLAATVLSVYKPRGLTTYGRRKLREQRTSAQSAT